MKFSELKIGEEFETAGMLAVKLASRSFKVVRGRRAGEVRTTAGNRNVNGPSGDEAHAAKQKTERDRLNEIAQSAGYASWSALGRAALGGDEIRINWRKYA